MSWFKCEDCGLEHDRNYVIYNGYDCNECGGFLKKAKKPKNKVEKPKGGGGGEDKKGGGGGGGKKGGGGEGLGSTTGSGGSVVVK